MAGVRQRLDELVAEFADLDAREKLELLVDFANGLPPLEPDYAARKTVEDRRVHDGIARLVAEVAPEAPTVKGFVAILAEAINGRPTADVAEVSDDVLERMGLADVLGILRARGLRAIVARIKRGFAAATSA
jgi:cysteine desulfuration protein SufE